MSAIRESPSSLDLTWLKFSLNYISGVFVLTFIVHCPLFLILPTDSNSKQKNIHFRNLSQSNYTKFHDHIYSFKWSSLTENLLFVFKFMLQKLLWLYLEAKLLIKKKLKYFCQNQKGKYIYKQKSSYMSLFQSST